MKRREYIVSVPIVEGVSHERMKGYIEEAVSCWGGQFRPAGGYGLDDQGDPLGPPCVLGEEGAVRVRQLRRRK